MSVLYCVECGCCSGELGKGWVAMRCDDPDPDMGDEPTIALYCPPCAAGEFGNRPDVLRLRLGTASGRSCRRAVDAPGCPAL